MDYLLITVREATLEDIPAILEIENLCFKCPWKKENLLYELNDNQYANLWVIELENQLSHEKVIGGFCDYWATFDTATLCQIAVHPMLQHRQLGTAMMDEIYNDCYAKKIRTITLEVRVSNQTAISFYEKQGFKKECIKPHYYDNGEDAYYMILEVEN